MKPTRSDGDFERWLERELRRTVAAVRGPNPLAAQAAYRAASRSGGRSLTMRSGVFARGAAGLVAGLLTIGGGSAVAMATMGTANPVELGQRVAGIVQACKDQVRFDDHDKNAAASVDSRAASAARNNRGIGQCVSSQVNHNQNGEAQQQANGVKDADEHKAARPSTSPGTHQDHGQGAGGGSAGAPGQGGSGHGNSGDHRPTPSPHTPSPHP